MPICSENEPLNIFNQDLFQSTSIIDLLQDSPDVNMSSYMSDEETLGLPPMLTSELSPIGGSVNVLDMINQDVMFGNNLQSMTSNASTEVTYVIQNTALSAVPFTSAGDVFLPSIPTTTVTNTFVNPIYQHVSSSSAKQIGKSILKHNPKPWILVSSEPGTSQSPNRSVHFASDQKQSRKRPFAATTHLEHEKDHKTKKLSSNLSTNSKCKSRGSRKSTKSEKRSSRNSSETLNIPVVSSQKEHVPTSIHKEIVRPSARTHTVTRTTNVITKRTVALTAAVTHTMTTVPPTVDLCTVTEAKATATKNALGAVISSQCTTSIPTPYTFTRARAPTSIISPVHCTYLRSNVLRSTPIISRTPAAAPSRAGQFAIVRAQTTYAIPTRSGGSSASGAEAVPRPRTRLVIPMPLNAYVTSVASVDRYTVSAANQQRAIHPLRPVQNAPTVGHETTHAVSTTSNTTPVMNRAFNHSSFAIPPVATLYAARKARSHSGVATDSRTFTIVDGKGSYTTLTISPDFATATSTSLVMTQTQNTTSVAAGVTKTLPVASDPAVRPRSQLLIPIANSQMNTSTSLGYLVTSPIGSSLNASRSSAPSTVSVATTATTIASHTITTISSEALNRIRRRLIYNVPSTSAELDSLSPATTSTECNRARGPVTIISNQLISAVNPHVGAAPKKVAASVAIAPRAMFSAASPQGLYTITAPITTVSTTSPAEHATRPVNRVVIPINVHGTSASLSSVSNQGAYILAEMGTSPSTAGETVTTPSRMVIPIMHNTSVAKVASQSPTRPCPAARPSPTARPCPTATGRNVCTTSINPTDAHSKLRSRLTIQDTTESSMPSTTTSITPYTISRTRTTQRVHVIPSGSAPCISSTKTSEGTKSPATMTFITFTSPSTVGGPATGAPQRTPPATQGETPSPTLISATPTLASTGNRIVIKLATSQSAASGGSVTYVTTSTATPITSAVLIPTKNKFAEPHSLNTGLRTFPGPRTYSIPQRSAAGHALKQTVARNVNPRVTKAIANPAPLQIFADVVCPPMTVKAQTTVVATHSDSKPRFTLSHSSGTSTLVVPQYKNMIFKNLSTIAHPNPEQTSSRFLGPRASTERFVLNRSVALVSSRRAGPGIGGRCQRDPRSPYSPPAGRASHVASDGSSLPPASNTSRAPSNEHEQND